MERNIILRGLNPARDACVSRIGEQMATGEWLAHDDPKGVVLGQRLARTLDVEAGAEVVVLSQAADGSMASHLFHVRGVLKPITDSADRAAVFMLDREFRELMVFPEGAHQLFVRTPNEVAGVVMEPILRVWILPESAVATALIILGATLLSGLNPAWRAGRVNPVDTIKLV